MAALSSPAPTKTAVLQWTNLHSEMKTTTARLCLAGCAAGRLLHASDSTPIAQWTVMEAPI